MRRARAQRTDCDYAFRNRMPTCARREAVPRVRGFHRWPGRSHPRWRGAAWSDSPETHRGLLTHEDRRPCFTPRRSPRRTASMWRRLPRGDVCWSIHSVALVMSPRSTRTYPLKAESSPAAASSRRALGVAPVVEVARQRRNPGARARDGGRDTPCRVLRRRRGLPNAQPLPTGICMHRPLRAPQADSVTPFGTAAHRVVLYGTIPGGNELDSAGIGTRIRWSRAEKRRTSIESVAPNNSHGSEGSRGQARRFCSLREPEYILGAVGFAGFLWAPSGSARLERLESR